MEINLFFLALEHGYGGAYNKQTVIEVKRSLIDMIQKLNGY